MTPYRKRECQLTKRLAEDMMIRNLADSTIDAYTYHVRRFADLIDKPLERATVEDVRTFQLYLIQDKKVAESIGNSTSLRSSCFRARHRTKPMPTHRSKKRSSRRPNLRESRNGFIPTYFDIPTRRDFWKRVWTC